MKYLIWSNEHGMWVREGGGFTWIIGLAARYEETHARQFAGRALQSGLLYPPHPNMVLVPEPQSSHANDLTVVSPAAPRVSRSPLASLRQSTVAA